MGACCSQAVLKLPYGRDSSGLASREPGLDPHYMHLFQLSLISKEVAVICVQAAAIEAFLIVIVGV